MDSNIEEQDDYQSEGEEELSPEICLTNEILRQKILSSDTISDLEMEVIQSSASLKNVYKYRWWRDEDDQSYLVIKS